VSSDLEQMLREARQSLPAPEDAATEGARRRVLATLRPHRVRTRTRVLVLAGATLVTALLLGVTAGSLNAPSVTAAREPAVLGFVPEPGWFALQSPPAAIPGQQTAAVAANVPFAPDDVQNGLVEPSGLPYATLLTLPADGIVLVATMTPQAVPQVPSASTGLPYTDIELPLRIRDALPVLHWWAQVRPDPPLAQYHLSGSLHGQNVDVVVYFGTPQVSQELMRQAQRQLSGFVFRPGKGAPRSTPAVIAAPVTTKAVVDRTYVCETVILGGLYQVEVRAHGGERRGGEAARLPYAGVSTGGNAGRIDTSVPPGSALAWITAGVPSHRTTVDDAYDAFSVQAGGTLGRNTELCRSTSTRVPLSRVGLRGGDVGRAIHSVECDAPRRVLLRLRATTVGSAALRDRGRIFAAVSSPIVRAELAVRTPAGRPLAYAAVDESGKSRLFTAKGCTRE
jgi:hypothetical protein